MNLNEGGKAKIMHDTVFVDRETGKVKHQSLTESGWRKIGANTRKRRNQSYCRKSQALSSTLVFQ